jgi:hypothetical protein
VDFWRLVKLVLGITCILEGLFSKEFKPIGWTTALIWGKDENARIPRWVAGPFYVVLGSLVIYWAVTGK